MNYLSVCSGIEAATVAWHPLGWRASAYAEIDAFPSALLSHYYPETPNRGDMSRFQEWPDAAVDVLVGGTPCQSFSVAGLRKGLADPRGNLTLTFLAIAARYRPAWLVWENVPGVLSDATGAFGSFLGGLAELGYGWAYRVLDAQYFGVAQRRRRVFVVGCARGWQRAGAVLLERESLSGNPAPRRGQSEDATGTLTSSAARRRGSGTDPAHITHALKGEGHDASEDGTGRGVPLVPEVCGTLSDGAHNGGGLNGQDAYTGRILPVAFDTTQVTSRANRSSPKHGDPCHPLAAGAHAPAIAFAELADPIAANQGRTYTREGTHNFRLSNVAHSAMRVRRLTPRECERLQGFPDDYTLVPYRGKPAADGPRYKALGNSMAVPVMRWIGERIQAVEALECHARRGVSE